MFENEAEGQQYISGLQSQLNLLLSQFKVLDEMPIVVRQRKGSEPKYQSLKTQIESLKEKIKMASTRSEEMMAMEEAQGAGQRISDSFQKNIKVAAIVSGIALVSIILGAIIYKKVKSK